MSKILNLPTPKKFSFQSTIKSHGWYQLHPFDFDPENSTLETIIDAGKPVSVKIQDGENSLQIEVSGEINEKAEDKILKDVGHIFRFDEDLSEFYQLIKTEKHLSWLSKQKWRKASSFDNDFRRFGQKYLHH